MTTDTTQDPCRIFGVVAPAAPIVVLLRRGPSRWVQMVQWQTETDTFVNGQWLRNHVYERRCALSPNGQLFVYFTSKVNRRTREDESTTHAWTAVSRPPYFTALALWPKGDTWNGGGVFQDNRTLLLNHLDSSPKQPPAKHRLRVVAGRAIPWFDYGEDEPIHSAILKQQGWQCIQAGHFDDLREQVLQQFQDSWDGGKLQLLATTAAVWQKARPGSSRRFLLRQTFFGVDFNQYGSPYVQDWEIVDTTNQQAQRIERAEWAAWDRRGRLIFTRQGQVWASLPEAYPEGADCLADLNEQRPAPNPSPNWARRWP